ncbi:MAG: hypothetical protein KAX18_02925 [Candidatus Lokiarchaeota archaeon]|nr:hypothetical protein [Candidatus Lokiarchaeota archaeon]
MAVLEVGINLGKKPLVEIKYYSSSDNVFDPKIRALFLTGIEHFIDEAFGDKINVISLSDFKFICYFKKVRVPSEDKNNIQLLLSFAIIEQGTNPRFVKKHLKKIISEFRNQYALSDILSKDSGYFQQFEPRINEILGDLRFKIDDRLRSLFRD